LRVKKAQTADICCLLSLNNTYAQNQPAKYNLMDEHHYLGFHSLTGKTLKYAALLEGQWVALIGWGSAALKSRRREKWVGWSQEQKAQRLKFIANNQRYPNKNKIQTFFKDV